MATNLRVLLDERAAALPGRDAERAALLDLVRADRPLVAVVYGIAGVGKSALVRAFAADARERGTRVAALGGRAVEPTERGFLDAIGQALDRPVGGLRDALDALDEHDGRTIVVIDHAERLRLLDPWLRLRLVPALPAGVRVLVAGRDGPGRGCARWAPRSACCAWEASLAATPCARWPTPASRTGRRRRA